MFKFFFDKIFTLIFLNTLNQVILKAVTFIYLKP